MNSNYPILLNDDGAFVNARNIVAGHPTADGTILHMRGGRTFTSTRNVAQIRAEMLALATYQPTDPALVDEVPQKK